VCRHTARRWRNQCWCANINPSAAATGGCVYETAALHGGIVSLDIVLHFIWWADRDYGFCWFGHVILSLRHAGPVIAKRATNREVLRASFRPLIRLRLDVVSSAQVWRFVTEYLIWVGGCVLRTVRAGHCVCTWDCACYCDILRLTLTQTDQSTLSGCLHSNGSSRNNRRTGPNNYH